MFAVVVFGGFLSGFVSNTGTVAVLLPIVMGAAAVKKMPPSRLLIPLAYGATLGGNLSVIGSPGNLVAKETIERLSDGTMTVAFFEYAKAGVPLLLAGAVFLALFGRRIVPGRPSEAVARYAPKPGTSLGWKSCPTVVAGGRCCRATIRRWWISFAVDIVLYLLYNTIQNVWRV